MSAFELAAPSALVYWPGAKAKYRGTIVGALTRHPHHRYVEPFCGGAWVFLAKRPVPNEWLNDQDEELMNFLVQLADPPAAAELERRLGLVGVHSRALVERLAALPPAWLAAEEPLVRALRFILVNRIGGGRGVWQDRLADAAPARWDRVLADVQLVTRRLRGVHIERGDGVTLVRRLDAPETTFYLDPPYLDDRPGRPSADPVLHGRLAEALAGLAGRFLLTHPDHDFWRTEARRHGWESAKLGREYQLDGTWREQWMFANFALSAGIQGSLFS